MSEQRRAKYEGDIAVQKCVRKQTGAHSVSLFSYSDGMAILHDLVEIRSKNVRTPKPTRYTHEMIRSRNDDLLTFNTFSIRLRK